jgi:acetyltransferase-like isoleucine patch superfamily enzyme
MRALLNRWRRRLAHALLHRRVFGERSQGRWLPHTRIAPSSCLEHEERLVLGDHVYIGPFNWIEASGGVTLEEGVQLTSHISIVTHSSHRAMRLMGRAYASGDAGRPGDIAGHDQERPGWIAGPVHIGAYSFIGPHVLIEAGSRLGRGCIVRAGSVVRGQFPDHAVIDGRPAVVVGDARDADRRVLAQHPRWRAAYEAWAGAGSGAAPR